MTPNEKIISAVESYVNDIIEEIKQQSFEMEVDLDFAEATSTDNTQSAKSALITTPIGAVVVIPDFAKNKAQACILRLGEIKCMEAEGFDEEFIEKNGKIYSKPLVKNKKNVHTLAYYLTHKLDVKKTHSILD